MLSNKSSPNYIEIVFPQNALDEATENWGIRVERVEMLVSNCCNTNILNYHNNTRIITIYCIFTLISTVILTPTKM